jgi:transcriptional regulator with XRE-family HTH domain
MNSDMSINTSWFRERLLAKNLSQRKLAKLLGLDPSAVSLSLRGMRELSSDEASRLAAILDVSVTEVLRQAGVRVNDDVRSVEVSFYLNDNSELVELTREERWTELAPSDLPLGGIAAQIRTVGGIFDRCVVFFGAPNADLSNTLDSLCAAQFRDGTKRVGKLSRGYVPNSLSFRTLVREVALINPDIVGASRLFWMKSQ